MRLAKEQMNLKATIKQLQGVKYVSLHEAIPRGVHVCLISIGIFVTLSLLLNTMYLKMVVI